MAAATLVHLRWNDISNEPIRPHIRRRYISGERVTIARFELAAGGIVPRHAHDQEQFTTVLSGRLKFVVDGQEIVVGPGEVAQIPGWVEHEVHVLEDAVVIDVFSPVRQDWIDKTDDYFRR